MYIYPHRDRPALDVYIKRVRMWVMVVLITVLCCHPRSCSLLYRVVSEVPKSRKKKKMILMQLQWVVGSSYFILLLEAHLAALE